MSNELLTEPEVAEILRCSTSKVKRLRLAGKLRYIPGRPILVARADLYAYLESLKVGAAIVGPPTKAEADVEMRRSAREWVLKKKLTRRRKIAI